MPISGERRVLWLLALASIPFAFVNTLFTQTVSFAADDFDRTDSAIGFGAAIVRWGVIIVPPIALFADRQTLLALVCRTWANQLCWLGLLVAVANAQRLLMLVPMSNGYCAPSLVTNPCLQPGLVCVCRHVTNRHKTYLTCWS